MENEILKDILQELKGLRQEVIDIKIDIKDSKTEQKKMSKSIKSIELNINKGVYEDLERIKERLNKLETKAV